MPAQRIYIRPLVYVAGPYTEGDRTENIRRAVMLMESIIEAGGTPFVPQLLQLADLTCPHDYDYWLDYCKSMVLRCDMVARMPGKSPGAEEEAILAQSANIPVYKYARIGDEEDRALFAIEYTYLGVSLREAIQTWESRPAANWRAAAAETNADEWRAIALRAMRGIGEMKSVVHKLNEDLNIDPETGMES